MANAGTATANFGTTPTDIASVAVADTGILIGSLTSAWIAPAVTADHTADEHIAEELDAYAGAPVAGVGFTIFLRCRRGFSTGTFNVQWAWT